MTDRGLQPEILRMAFSGELPASPPRARAGLSFVLTLIDLEATAGV